MIAGVPELHVSAVIDAPPQRILKAFFEPEALNAWWEVAHAVTTPRVLGPYAVAWETTEFRDAVLGRLGGVFRGTVMQYQADRGFFVADAFWLPPDGDPIGPMAFEVLLHADRRERHGRHRGPRDAAGLRGKRALAAVLRSHRARLDARPRVPQGAAGEVDKWQSRK